jgi:hypothetical protein
VGAQKKAVVRLNPRSASAVRGEAGGGHASGSPVASIGSKAAVHQPGDAHPLTTEKRAVSRSGGGSAAAGGGRRDAGFRTAAGAGVGGEPPLPPASSKVAVDPSGVLRVTHIVPLPGFSSTGSSSNNAVIQFVMYSCVEEEEEEEPANGGGQGGALAAVSDGDEY